MTASYLYAYSSKEIYRAIAFIKKKSKSKEKIACLDGAGKEAHILHVGNTGIDLFMLAE